MVHFKDSPFLMLAENMSLIFTGLQPYLTALNNAYSQCSIASRGISRADFYAKCGQVAAEIGRDNSTSK